MTLLQNQFLFIVGAPRSGTTWLHRLLAGHPDVAALEVELSLLKYLGDWEVRFQREKRLLGEGRSKHGLPLLYSEEEFLAGSRQLAELGYARAFQDQVKSSHILDKHPGYAFHIPTITRLIPHCKVIHIIRDGREVAVSMMSAARRLGFGADEIKGATRDWARHLRAARTYGKELGPLRYMEVRYEDLMEQPEVQLRQLFAFADLPVEDAAIAQILDAHHISKNQVSGGDTTLNELRESPGAIWRTRLSLVERWTMERMAGDLLNELGYSNRGWWALGPMDRYRMAWYSMVQKVRNTLGSAWHSARTPVVKRLEP